MNCLAKLLPVLVLLTGPGCLTAARPSMQDAALSPLPGPAEARIVFYRPPKYWRNAESWEIWAGQQRVGYIENGGAIEHRCAPGQHVFLLLHGSAPAIDADLAGGRTYFVEVEIRMGAIAYPAFVPRRLGSAAERDTTERNLARCIFRELKPDRRGSPGGEEAESIRKRIEEARGPRAAELLTLRPDDGE